MQSLTESEYYNSRTSTDILKYPNFWATTKSINNIISEFDHIEPGTRLRDNHESIIGRVMLKRASGKKLYFYTVLTNDINFQIMSDLSSFHSEDEFYRINELIHRGDIIGIKGFISKTKKGELSIVPTDMQILAPCLHMLPHLHDGLVDKELRYTNRYLDLMLNKEVRDIFKTRHLIISKMRNYLIERDFIEVETPVLSNQAGGATAKPFTTHHNAMKQDMFMRIAPELYLKQLVIGGLDRVFEIGKNFRNESIDTTHNPEFTACEFYMVGADYYKLIDMTQEMLVEMITQINGTTIVEWMGNDINFTLPFKQLDMMDELQNEIRIKLEDEQFVLPNLNSEHAGEEYKNLHDLLGVKVEPPFTLNRLVDNLVGEFVEPKCIQPTFLMNHPLIMSPLAKPHRLDSTKTERFELFINGKEICNAYTELNNPITQKEIFDKIAKQKEAGDNEIPPSDDHFVKALEYGLPPTAGWGIGIDRLTMLLTNKDSIREVILFPTRNYNQQNSNKDMTNMIRKDVNNIE
jgi:lysyl-tRNA synthetase, class II